MLVEGERILARADVERGGPFGGFHSPAGVLERPAEQRPGGLVVEMRRASPSTRNAGVERLVSRLRARMSSSGFWDPLYVTPRRILPSWARLCACCREPWAKSA